MQYLSWSTLTFSQLTTDQLYSLLQLRVDVFVVEQSCAYHELDGKDRHPQTLHLIGCDHRGNVVACARLLAPGVSYPQASIGRVVVAESQRGKGIAHELMKRAIAIVDTQWSQHTIQIGAQQHLVNFYARLGFEAVSEVYIEDGIPHVDMLR